MYASGPPSRYTARDARPLCSLLSPAGPRRRSEMGCPGGQVPSREALLGNRALRHTPNLRRRIRPRSIPLPLYGRRTAPPTLAGPRPWGHCGRRPHRVSPSMNGPCRGPSSRPIPTGPGARPSPVCTGTWNDPYDARAPPPRSHPASK